MSIVVFLQNAWSPVYAGGEWERGAWLKALERSRSGQRLKLLIDDFSVCYNTTPIVGATSDSVVPSDEKHIQRVLTQEFPSVVITCGKQAEISVKPLWGGAMLALPHPAYRVVTNKLFKEARRMLDEGFKERKALIQMPRTIIVRDLL